MWTNVNRVPGASAHVSMEDVKTHMDHTTAHVNLATRVVGVTSITMTAIQTSVKMAENVSMVLTSSAVYAKGALMDDTARMTLMSVHPILVKMVPSVTTMSIPIPAHVDLDLVAEIVRQMTMIVQTGKKLPSSGFS